MSLVPGMIRMVEEDLDELVAMDQDPELMRHITGTVPPRWAYEEVFVAGFLALNERRDGMGSWVLRQNDEMVGIAVLRPDKVDATLTEIGYRLKRSLWGKGVATWLARDLVRRGLAMPEVQTLVARIQKENIASIRVAEKSGLRRDSEFLFEAKTLVSINDPRQRYAIAESTGLLFKASRAQLAADGY